MIKFGGFDKVHGGYDRCRKVIFKPNSLLADEKEGRLEDKVCCDGIAGVCGLFFLLILGIFYVTYCIIVNRRRYPFGMAISNSLARCVDQNN